MQKYPLYLVTFAVMFVLLAGFAYMGGVTSDPHKLERIFSYYWVNEEPHPSSFRVSEWNTNSGLITHLRLTELSPYCEGGRYQIHLSRKVNDGLLQSALEAVKSLQRRGRSRWIEIKKAMEADKPTKEEHRLLNDVGIVGITALFEKGASPIVLINLVKMEERLPSAFYDYLWPMSSRPDFGKSLHGIEKVDIQAPPQQQNPKMVFIVAQVDETLKKLQALSKSQKDPTTLSFLQYCIEDCEQHLSNARKSQEFHRANEKYYSVRYILDFSL